MTLQLCKKRHVVHENTHGILKRNKEELEVSCWLKESYKTITCYPLSVTLIHDESQRT